MFSRFSAGCALLILACGSLVPSQAQDVKAQNPVSFQVLAPTFMNTRGFESISSEEGVNAPSFMRNWGGDSLCSQIRYSAKASNNTLTIDTSSTIDENKIPQGADYKGTYGSLVSGVNWPGAWVIVPEYKPVKITFTYEMTSSSQVDINIPLGRYSSDKVGGRLINEVMYLDNYVKLDVKGEGFATSQKKEGEFQKTITIPVSLEDFGLHVDGGYLISLPGIANNYFSKHPEIQMNTGQKKILWAEPGWSVMENSTNYQKYSEAV